MSGKVKKPQPGLDKKPSTQEVVTSTRSTNLGRVLDSLGSLARLEEPPKKKGEKDKKPRATKTNVKDQLDEYASQGEILRADPKYQDFSKKLAYARKTREEQKQQVQQRRSLGNDEMFRLAVQGTAKEIEQLEKEIKPLQDQIDGVDSQSKQVEDYLKDPTAKIEPGIKRAVDVRAEKPGAMTALKNQVDGDLKKAQTDPRHLKLVEEKAKADKEVQRLKNERPPSHDPHYHEQWEDMLGKAKEKAREANFNLQLSQTRIDSLQEQSRALEKQLGSGETTGLPPELQSDIDEKAENAVLFRGVQDELQKEIAAKDKELRQMLDKHGLSGTYENLERERESLRSMQKKEEKGMNRGDDFDTAMSSVREKVAKYEKELEKGLGPHVNEFLPLAKQKEGLVELNNLATGSVDGMKFDLKATDPTAALLQQRVDKARIQAAGQEFKEKAAEVIVREAGVKRAEEKTDAAGKKRDKAQDELNNVVKTTPELKKAWESAETDKADLAEKTEERNKAAELLDGKAKEYEKLYSELLSGEPGEQFAKLEKLNKLTEEIEGAKKELRVADADLATATTTADKSQAALEKAIGEQAQSKPGSQLDNANKALTGAKDEANKADTELEKTQQKLQEAQAAAKQVEGRENVLKSLPDIRERTAKLKEQLNEVTDLGMVIWDEQGAEKIRKKLGDKKFAELEKNARQMQTDYETLMANGATTEELGALYKDGGIDEKWWPPQFRKDEQNWVAMKSFIEDENVAKRVKEEEKKIDKVIAGLSKGESLAGKLDSARKALSSKKGQEITNKIFGKELSEEQSEAVGKFAALAGAICNMSKAVATVAKSGAELNENESADPIEEMMLQDELMDAMGELAKTGLEVTGEVVKELWKELPGLDVISSSIDLMKALKETAERIANAVEDQRLFEEAQEKGHKGEKALAQFANRDKHLAARAGTDTAVAALGMAAGVATLTGVGAHAGAAMKTVAKGVKGAKEVGVFVVDKAAAQKAQDLFKKAQAGNPEARNELFQHHPRYAKGLMSLMAMEGDPLALACLKNHGLNEDMIARSSAPVIKKYLMKRFSETDEPSSWTDTWNSIKGAANKVAEGARKVVEAFVSLHDKINIAIGSRSSSVLLSQMRQIKSVSMNEIAETVSTCQNLFFRRTALAASSDGSQTQKEELTQLDTALGEARKKVGEIRTKIAESNGALATLQGKIADGLKSDSEDEDLQEAKKIAESLLRQHLQALDVVIKAL